MCLEQPDHRGPGLLGALRDLGEDRALLDLAPHVVAHADQHDGEQERHAPAPLQEGVTGGDLAHHGHRAGGEQQTERHPDLRARPVESPLVGGSVLDGHQRRTAPLAARGDALQDTQEQQQDRRDHPRRLVGGQHADQRGGDAHQHQRRHEHHATPVPVADVAGDEGAQRSEQEADADREERGDRGAGGAETLEEQLRQHERGRRGVDEEVVPLDGGADHGGGDHAPSFAQADLRGAGLRGVGGVGGAHESTPVS